MTLLARIQKQQRHPFRSELGRRYCDDCGLPYAQHPQEAPKPPRFPAKDMTGLLHR